jgi:hypothetical protein
MSHRQTIEYVFRAFAREMGIDLIPAPGHTEAVHPRYRAAVRLLAADPHDRDAQRRPLVLLHFYSIQLLLTDRMLCWRMVEVSLEMVLKRVEDVLAGQTVLTQRIDALDRTVGGLATTLVGVQRDLRGLQASVATLAAAGDDHTHRLDHIEKHLGIGTTPN